jgi:hypothetical protein
VFDNSEDQSSTRQRVLTRRDFVQGTLLATAAGCLDSDGQAWTAGTPSAGTHFIPSGELRTRIDMTQRRLTREGSPAFTEPFVLADVKLDPGYPRRFANYSGDLSGRYIGALALLPPDGAGARLDGIVRQVLRCQRPDGRFGKERLSFATQDIDQDQMALLWGNGRLLVGLLEYNSLHASNEVLQAARRLGEFLLEVQQRCSDPGIARRLSEKGAAGYICFTQLVEALVMLGQQTHEQRYYSAAARIVPLLQPRGNQHSHGYLTTLRGILELYKATGDGAHLKYVEEAYRDLVASADYAVTGGVYEYFGSGPRNASPEEHGRDEGCSEADFVRLSLQLWKVTGKPEYLELGERCLLNEFFFNQFRGGDFGHHTSFRYGYRQTESIGRAWWCCTMHGLRAFRDIVDSVVTVADAEVRVNLFMEGHWTDGSFSFSLMKSDSVQLKNPGGYSLTIQSAPPREVSLAIRKPQWSSESTLWFKGQPLAASEHDGYGVIKRRWEKGETVELSFSRRIRIQTREGKLLLPGEMEARPREAALFVGPYLLGADSGREPAFFGEPWIGSDSPNGNIVLLPGKIQPAETYLRGARSAPLELAEGHCRLEYLHGGWPKRNSLTLRPVSEQTMSEPQTLAFWLNYKRA